MMREFTDLLQQWRRDFATGAKAHAEIVAEFVLVSAARLHGDSWLGSQLQAPPSGSGSLVDRLKQLGLPLSKRALQRLTGLDRFAQLLRHFQIKGVREDSHLGLLGWLEGRYPLELRLDQPFPIEMLELQSRGRRLVTLHLDPSDQDRAIGRHAGAYGFCLHDLEHAEKFFGHEMRGQIHFFTLLQSALRSGHFHELANENQFSGELNYLMSDMNSHPVHLLEYMKAVVIDRYKRLGRPASESLNDWSRRLFTDWQFADDLLDSALRLNFPGLEREEDRARLAAHFQGAL